MIETIERALQPIRNGSRLSPKDLLLKLTGDGPTRLLEVLPSMRGREAPSGMRVSLQADGFDLQVEGFEGGVLSLIVLAGPEACHECLLPQEHMQLRIEDRLRGIARAVRLRYPENPNPSH